MRTVISLLLLAATPLFAQDTVAIDKAVNEVTNLRGTLDGSLLFSFGSLGSNSNAGQFLNPRAVAVSASGVVAVADFQANLISLWH